MIAYVVVHLRVTGWILFLVILFCSSLACLQLVVKMRVISYLRILYVRVSLHSHQDLIENVSKRTKQSLAGMCHVW